MCIIPLEDLILVLEPFSLFFLKYCDINQCENPSYNEDVYTAIQLLSYPQELLVVVRNVLCLTWFGLVWYICISCLLPSLYLQIGYLFWSSFEAIIYNPWNILIWYAEDQHNIFPLSGVLIELFSLGKMCLKLYLAHLFFYQVFPLVEQWPVTALIYFFLLFLWTWFLILWIYPSTWVPFHICQVKFQLVPRRLVGLTFHSPFACFPLAFESVKSTRFVQVGLLLHLLAVIIYMNAPEVICFGKYQKNTIMGFFCSLNSFMCCVSYELDSLVENNFPQIFFNNHNRF